MANRHFAKLADVWKHLPLAEILSIERPSAYWESHAGSAVYPMVDDPERLYGALHFVDVAPRFGALSRSRYLEHLAAPTDLVSSDALRPASYPGSPLLAMRELGATSSYLFCDLDPRSVADLEAAAAGLRLGARVRVVASDGMTALHRALAAADTSAGERILAHVDPYDPWAADGSSGLSALDLATELVERKVGLVYWYGYDQPEQRAWALQELLRRCDRGAALWCGDVLVASSDGVPPAGGGDLGAATSPGTGFGVMCANVSADSIAACELLGEELADAYECVPLPDGSPGHLDFESHAAGST